MFVSACPKYFGFLIRNNLPKLGDSVFLLIKHQVFLDELWFYLDISMLLRYGSDLYHKTRIATNLLGIVDHMNSLVCFMFSFTEAEMLYGVMTVCPLFSC